MEIIRGIYGLLARIPIWIWLIVAVCILAPTFAYFFKRSAKMLCTVIVVLAILFMCPSIVQSFMDRMGLTWDNESGTVTNKDGQSIQLLLPENKDERKDVNDDTIGTLKNLLNSDVLKGKDADTDGINLKSILGLLEKFGLSDKTDVSADDLLKGFRDYAELIERIQSEYGTSGNADDLQKVNADYIEKVLSGADISLNDFLKLLQDNNISLDDFKNSVSNYEELINKMQSDLKNN